MEVVMLMRCRLGSTSRWRYCCESFWKADQFEQSTEDHTLFIIREYLNIDVGYTRIILMHILRFWLYLCNLVHVPESSRFQLVHPSLSSGNMFYLVMPRDQMGALTEESSTDEVSDPSPSEAPEAASSSSQQDDEEQESPRRSHLEVSSNEAGLSQSQASTQQHAIKNVDEIFQTMDKLMKKLHRLRVNTNTLVNTPLACRRYPCSSHFTDAFIFCS